jgi:hypothetical protein
VSVLVNVDSRGLSHPLAGPIRACWKSKPYVTLLKHTYLTVLLVILPWH